MTGNQAVTVYSRGSKWLHWLVAIGVIALLPLSFFLDDVPLRYQGLAYLIHKSIGLSILALMCARLFWIAHTGKPELPSDVPVFERHLSKFVQYSLYFFLLAQPLCGWIMSIAANRTPIFWDLFPLPFYGIPVSKPLAHFLEKTHTIMAWILIALIVLHLLGALKHYVIDKDKILNRMLS